MKFKRIRETAIFPTRATEQSAGLDLYACLDAPLSLLPGERVRIPVGWACDPEREDCVLMICARSGLASKFGVTMANGVGIVDSDYRGELQVPVVNLSDTPYTLQPGERFAQLLLLPCLFPELSEAETLRETRRGSGGFGSSGR